MQAQLKVLFLLWPSTDISNDPCSCIQSPFANLTLPKKSMRKRDLFLAHLSFDKSQMAKACLRPKYDFFEIHFTHKRNNKPRVKKIVMEGRKEKNHPHWWDLHSPHSKSCRVEQAWATFLQLGPALHHFQVDKGRMIKLRLHKLPGGSLTQIQVYNFTEWSLCGRN